jgi:hypothetical protein
VYGTVLRSRDSRNRSLDAVAASDIRTLLEVEEALERLCGHLTV